IAPSERCSVSDESDRERGLRLLDAHRRRVAFKHRRAAAEQGRAGLRAILERRKLGPVRNEPARKLIAALRAFWSDSPAEGHRTIERFVATKLGLVTSQLEVARFASGRRPKQETDERDDENGRPRDRVAVNRMREQAARYGVDYRWDQYPSKHPLLQKF